MPFSKKTNKYTVVGLGELLWDVFPDDKKMGGAPANFAYHVNELGEYGVIVSSVGDDKLGKEIKNNIGDLGLNSRYIYTDNNHPTGTVTIKLDEMGGPEYTIHENVAWDFIPWNSNLQRLAERTDAVCFGSLCQRNEVSRNTINKFLKAVKPDCFRIFDINLRQSYFDYEIIHSSLKLSNVLKLNNEELRILANLLKINGPEKEIIKGIAGQYNLQLIALSSGEKGSLLYGKGEYIVHKGFKVKVVDTVGAGDAFAAVLAVGLLRGNSIDPINEHANKVASYVCSMSGATPELPHYLIKF
jgi:fructokinase